MAGAAWRRRQRRLRMHWRSRCKCSWPRTSTTPAHGDRAGPGAGGWERDALHGQVPEHPTPQVAGTEYFSLDVEDVPATGSRPDRLAGVRPQERVQQHFVDQFVDTASALPILDVPVPLMGEQLVEVPTIVPYSSLLQQTVEQHVDIPVPGGGGRLAGLQGSLPGQSSTAPSVVRIVDIPGGGLQRFSPWTGFASVFFFSFSSWIG